MNQTSGVAYSLEGIFPESFRPLVGSAAVAVEYIRAHEPKLVAEGNLVIMIVDYRKEFAEGKAPNAILVSGGTRDGALAKFRRSAAQCNCNGTCDASRIVKYFEEAPVKPGAIVFIAVAEENVSIAMATPEPVGVECNARGGDA